MLCLLGSDKYPNMNSIVMSPPTSRQARGGILVIEPDSSRAATLRDILRHHACNLEIVESVAAALRSLAAQIPDLLLTSTFLPPVDEALLMRTSERSRLPRISR